MWIEAARFTHPSIYYTSSSLWVLQSIPGCNSQTDKCMHTNIFIAASKFEQVSISPDLHVSELWEKIRPPESARCPFLIRLPIQSSFYCSAYMSRGTGYSVLSVWWAAESYTYYLNLIFLGQLIIQRQNRKLEEE